MRNRKGIFCMGAGLLLLMVSLLLTIYNFWDENRAAKSLLTVLQAFPVIEKQEGNLPNGSREMSTVEIQGEEYIGMLQIPALELIAPVQSDWNDLALKESPCRYSGSVYGNDLVVAGHNYQAHFGSLQMLQAGDNVIFTDAQGNVFRYTVQTQEILDGSDVEGMKSGDWDLTLFTCTYSGRERIAVRCVREKA